MARNEEKHYGKLNRLILLKEKEEYEKTHPKRPRLDLLDTPEEVQKWLPSIKRDIDFYLKKSQVTCYSDEHVEECKLKVIKLEKEFKAFVRKISQLTPGGLDATPWSSRPYKRKTKDPAKTGVPKEFMRIATPILNEEKRSEDNAVPVFVNLPLMDKPLSFEREDFNRNLSNSESSYSDSRLPLCSNRMENKTEGTSNSDCVKDSDSNYSLPPCASHIANKSKNQIILVNYDSSDAEETS